MNRFVAVLLLALSLCFGMASSGCSLFSPISGIIQIGIFWYEGEAHKYYACDQQKLHYAVKSVLKEFKLPIKKEYTKHQTIYIHAGDDDRFKIKVTAVRQNVAKLSIRINTFGDKPYAELIYRHVDKQQGIEQFATAAELNRAMEHQRR